MRITKMGVMMDALEEAEKVIALRNSELKTLALLAKVPYRVIDELIHDEQCDFEQKLADAKGEYYPQWQWKKNGKFGKNKEKF